MNKKYYLRAMLVAAAAMPLASCSDDDNSPSGTKTDAEYVGKAVGNFSADEWYPGGKLGTTDNVTAGCYEDETPAVSADDKLLVAFNRGESLFERNFNVGTPPFNGLGPAYLRTSCIDCHPGYGHGKAQPTGTLRAVFGNGYLMAIYHPTDGDGSNNFSGSDGHSNNGGYISEVTGMPQQKATAPFLAPIDEDKITIEWKDVTSMPSGLAMRFPDNGETFSLHYPEVRIPESAFRTDPAVANIAVRLESTIGIIGTGMIDAIPQDSIIAQYKSEAAYFEMAHGIDSVKYFLNPNMWNAQARQMAKGAWYKTWTAPGALANGVKVDSMLKRYTYALTRASLQDGPGANAIWNITNVSRSDRPKLYTTKAWAKKMSETPSVIQAIKADPTSPYFADGTEEGIADAVLHLLDPTTNQFNNEWHNFTPEQDDDSYYAFMVWHRGLSIPRARNLNDKDVQQGKKLFNKMGCVNCHRPSWTTGDDNYWISDNIKGRKLPKYPNQKIYPYSDFVQHKLDMINDIHGSWCRTTPLWGRGLSLANTGAEERLHDCRARNEVEAIMWHAYSKNSQAYSSAVQFYNLKKSDRDAVVKFLRSI